MAQLFFLKKIPKVVAEISKVCVFIKRATKKIEMTSQELDELLKRYVNDRCTEEERRFVEKSFDAMSQGQGDLEPQIRMAMQKRLWNRLRKEVGSGMYSRKYHYLKIGRVAAALLLLAVSLYLIGWKMTSHYHANIANQLSGMIRIDNPGKFVKTIKLKDGSVIALHPNGVVNFRESFGSIREVYLVGDAFFDVAKDSAHPFFVYANEVTTKVLGTSFLVKANTDGKEVTVSVKTGKVSVYTKNAEANTLDDLRSQQKIVILTPNQQAVYNRKEDRVVVTIADDPQVIGAQPPAAARYTNAPVIQLLKSLEASYGIHIQYDERSLSNCTITSDMVEEGFYEQVEIICNAIGARYKISGLSIVIESNGCK